MAYLYNFFKIPSYFYTPSRTIGVGHFKGFAMKSLLLAVLVLVPIYSFAQDAKMPAEAKRVIDKYDASVEAAKKVFETAVAKARDQALKDLKPIQVSETKKGNLDGAMLVKSKVDELTAEIQKPAAEGDLAKPIPPSTDPRVAMLIGKWKVYTTGYSVVYEFKDEGEVTRIPNNIGKYSFEKDKLVITWNNGEVVTAKLPKPGVTIMDAQSSRGLSYKFEKE